MQIIEGSNNEEFGRFNGIFSVLGVMGNDMHDGPRAIAGRSENCSGNRMMQILVFGIGHIFVCQCFPHVVQQSACNQDVAIERYQGVEILH